MATNENLPPRVIKELARELKSLDESPPDDIRVSVNEDNFSTIFADIDGPPGTPYEGGVFCMKLVLGQDFPQTPPKGYFMTKIFHPNIAKNGEICVNTLKKDWKPTLGLRHVLLVVRCLLIEPFPESALNEDAGKMLMEDYEGYAKHARLLTSIHALKPKVKSKVVIGESTAVNAGPGDSLSSQVVPLASNVQHRDNNSDNGTASTTEVPVFNTTATMSPKRVESELSSSAKVPLDKKKLEARKKGLKRL
ncbi:hypothetical protein L7F22_020513 [Adiantum nelumboides]|nr:hypothetical protein [Adiantum nelumboides]